MKICLFCKKEFKKPYNCSKKSWLSVKYCSKDCDNKTRKGKRLNNALEIYYQNHPHKIDNLKPGWNKGIKGKASHKYIDGRTSVNALERRKFVLTIQKEILKRDKYTCQMCESKRDLQVDHIQSWAEYVELRFSMDNCRTLCRSCHFKITYGKSMPHDSKWGLNYLSRTT